MLLGHLDRRPGQYVFDTTVATTSSPWPCAPGENDVWFHFTATATTTYVLDTCLGASFDTTLEVLAGPCTGLVSIACNDDACGQASELQLAATQGSAYFVRVGGRAGAAGPGILRISDTSAVGGCNFSDVGRIELVP